ncbi:hypothetical protein AMTRI_Chr09g14620 [Amborella trichopoda]
MINSKKITEIAPKWQKQPMRQRAQISLKTNSEEVGPVADEGHFVIYTTDGSRLMIPLLLLAEEVFGFTGCGPLREPCDAFAMEYVVSLLRKNASKELDKALAYMGSCRTSLASLAFHQTTPANMIPTGY